jgi:uncharacterized protein YndB with AHSA1/START domain
MLTKLTISKEIQASPEKIFAFVISERMNEVWGEWMEGHWNSKGSIGVGSKGVFDTKGMLKNFGKLSGEVTEFEENKKMTMHTIDAKGKMDATDTIFLEPTTNGTKTTYVTEYKVPYSVFGKLIDKVKISKDMENMHVKMLENLKKAVEV